MAYDVSSDSTWATLSYVVCGNLDSLLLHKTNVHSQTHTHTVYSHTCIFTYVLLEERVVAMRHRASRVHLVSWGWKKKSFLESICGRLLFPLGSRLFLSSTLKEFLKKQQMQTFGLTSVQFYYGGWINTPISFILLLSAIRLSFPSLLCLPFFDPSFSPHPSIDRSHIHPPFNLIFCFHTIHSQQSDPSPNHSRAISQLIHSFFHKTLPVHTSLR